MKNLMTIFGAFFFTALVLTSCGEANLQDLDKDIENEEDAVDALITLTKAKIEMLEKFKGPMQDLADLSKEMKKRGEDIEEAQEDVADKIYDEDWDEEDLEDADNWDEYEDLVKDLEELGEDILELGENIEENMEDNSNVLQMLSHELITACSCMKDITELAKKMSEDGADVEALTKEAEEISEKCSEAAQENPEAWKKDLKDCD